MQILFSSADSRDASANRSDDSPADLSDLDLRQWYAALLRRTAARAMTNNVVEVGASLQQASLQLSSIQLVGTSRPVPEPHVPDDDEYDMGAFVIITYKDVPK